MHSSEICAAKAILRSVKPTTLWGIAIVGGREDDAKIPRLVRELKEAHRDKPEMIEEIVGKENCKILFKK